MFPEGTFRVGNCDCSPWEPDPEIVFSRQGADTLCDLRLTNSTQVSYTTKYLEALLQPRKYSQKVFNGSSQLIFSVCCDKVKTLMNCSQFAERKASDVH